MVRSNLCDYSDAYVVEKGTLTVTDTSNVYKGHKNLTFKNNALFRTCISKINNTFINNADDLKILSMYDLLEGSSTYSMTSGSLRNYYIDEVNNDANENDNNYRINSKTTKNRSFEYKTKIIGTTPVNKNTIETEFIVPLKHLSDFWRNLNLHLIDCKFELDLSWSRNFVVSEILQTAAATGNLLNTGREARESTGATFQVNTAKLDVPVVTFSMNGNINFLESIKQGFKIKMYCKRYSSEVTR